MAIQLSESNAKMESFTEESPSAKSERPRLLAKYNIPVHYLDFPYVEKCSKPLELERIIKILRSGEEGYYPELTAAAEARLRTIKPSSKLLIEATRVLSSGELDEKERTALSSDLNEWVEDARRNDEELLGNKCSSTISTECDIRKVINEPSIKESKNDRNKRISSTDYAQWDKYDPDTEILKMDLQEEKIKKEIFNNVVADTADTADENYIFATEAEALYAAKSEKEKGNDFYRAGEYAQALRHYSISLKCKPMVATYTNRALIHMRLAHHADAIDDCKMALEIESNNIKAHLRIAESYKALGQHEAAFAHAQTAVLIAPNNTVAQELTNSLRTLCGKTMDTTTHRRFVIEDVGGATTKEIAKPNAFLKSSNAKATNNKRVTFRSPKKSPKGASEEIVPIAGPSTMAPPFCMRGGRAGMMYEVCHTIPLTILNLEEEDEDCTVIHIGAEKEETGGSEKIEVVTKKREETTSEKITKDCKREKTTTRIDEAAGGDCKSNELFTAEDLQQPYTFIQAWTSIKFDPTYKAYAEILKKIDFQRIHHVIGCQMDDRMFSVFINCLYAHFMVPGQIDRLHAAITHMRNISRFQMLITFISRENRARIRQMFDFLDQHGRTLPHQVLIDYLIQ